MRFRSMKRGAAIVAVLASAIAAAAQTQVVRYLGTVTAISGDTLTVKTDAGQVNTVEVPSSAQLKRIAPGQTDLSKAEPIDFASIATGDRVLVNLDPNSTGGTPQALRVIAIKQADVAKKQQTEAEQWNQGVHGLVKSVDAATGVIQVNTRVGAVTKEVNVNTTVSTVLKRYAPGSVRFDEAQPAPISAIQPGDQLWARGTKNADGTAIARIFEHLLKDADGAALNFQIRRVPQHVHIGGSRREQNRLLHYPQCFTRGEHLTFSSSCLVWCFGVEYRLRRIEPDRTWVSQALDSDCRALS